ncbi:TIGR02270 family protein [Myxococcus sp. RHSTA-1-4]|uniref:TIGR02270 family protein n=1 Tax=Myxococcus sp. RHSTA-1-4 TaxID=2874601 RepID=UPI001CBFE7AA|nr:TIGR02270 family protein [Myxococcus sp. RHSTA-1-4]MBZ4417925.1 TIGR02270 family protein [Myxococcus sp. RHSTA-1-4]
MLRGRYDATVHRGVLEDCLDEARYGWQQRGDFLCSAELRLSEVEDVHEERLRACVDVLACVPPREARCLLRKNLTEDDRERVAVASLALLARGEEAETEAVLEELRGGEERRVWVGEALEVAEGTGLGARLAAWVDAEGEEPEVRAVVLEALAVRGESPGAARLTRALVHPAPELRRAALRAARRFPKEAEGARVRQGLESAAPELRAAALEAGLVQGQHAVWRACQEAAEAPDVAGRTARLLLALGGAAPDVERLARLAEVPMLRRDALWALGFSGSALAAEACLPWLSDALLGPLAGEAFSAVTGLRLEGDYGHPRPAGVELPPLEEDLELSLLPGPDDALQVPHAREVERWWAGARKGFDSRERYLGGRPCTEARLVQALDEVPMRRRGPLLLELAIRTQGEHAADPRAWAHVQRRQLGGVREWAGDSPLRPFGAWMNR